MAVLIFPKEWWSRSQQETNLIAESSTHTTNCLGMDRWARSPGSLPSNMGSVMADDGTRRDYRGALHQNVESPACNSANEIARGGCQGEGQMLANITAKICELQWSLIHIMLCKSWFFIAPWHHIRVWKYWKFVVEKSIITWLRQRERRQFVRSDCAL